MTIDKNSLAFWFPKVEKCGLPVPRTRIVTTEADLSRLLDGKTPDGYDDFMGRLGAAVEEVGAPCFLRTGHGSGKHEWVDTCYVGQKAKLGYHVWALVEWSHLVDIMGLPTDVWAVRELIETKPLFHAFRGHMPITREFRAFADDDEVETILPYWPPGAIERPDAEDWHVRLHEASTISLDEYVLLSSFALEAVKAVGGGYWSVDFLQDCDGLWWLTDMADGERSYKWTDDEPAKYEERLGGS